MDGVIISGGDGLVYEVVTGYFNHPDQEKMKNVALGFAPAGTANAMANHLHQRDTKYGARSVFILTRHLLTLLTAASLGTPRWRCAVV